MPDLPHIGYILGHQEDYSELRYSLRSLRFLPHGEVFITGAPPPDWCVNVHHIPTTQRPVEGSGVDKYVNIKYNQRLNLSALCRDVDRFVLMNDDFMFTQPLEKLPLTPNVGHIDETLQTLDPTVGPYQALYHWFREQQIYNPLRFAEHVPMEMEGESMGEWMKEVWHIPGFPIPTLYGNMMAPGTVRGQDHVLKHDRHRESWPDNFWSVSTVEWAFYDWPVGEKIRGLHSEPSPYEREGA